MFSIPTEETDRDGGDDVRESIEFAQHQIVFKMFSFLLRLTHLPPRFVRNLWKQVLMVKLVRQRSTRLSITKLGNFRFTCMRRSQRQMFKIFCFFD